MTRPRGKPIPAETRRLIQVLLDEGASQTEAARRAGVSQSYIAKNFNRRAPAPGSATPGASPPPPREEAPPPPPSKPRPDPEPKRSPRRRAGKRNASDEELEAMVRKIAKAPAIPAQLWLRCDYCAAHYRNTAGPLSVALIDAAHDDRDLHDILQWCWKSWHRYAWAGLLGSWMGIPLIHHLAPDFVYRVAGPLAGMPPRGQPQPHFHATPDEVFETPQAPGGPFAGLDIDQLLKTAQAFGIQIPDMDNNTVDASAAPIPSDGDEPAEAEAAAAQADPDPGV